MTAILIIGIFEAVFLVGLILTKRKKQWSDYILMATLLIMALTIIASYIEQYNLENNFPYPFFIHISPPLIFLHGPLLWLYVKSVTSQNFAYKPHYILHLLPFAIALFAMYISTYRFDNQIQIEFMKSEEFQSSTIYPIIVGALALFTQSYFFAALCIIKKYRKNLKNYLSKIDAVDLHWLKFLIISAIVAYAINSSLFIIDYAVNLLPYQALQLTTFAIGSLLILALGFYGIKHTNVFADISINLDSPHQSTEVASNTNINTADELFIAKLIEHFKTEKPYTNPEITIAKLSKELKVGTEYLSGILNKQLHKNFFDFINQYRVEEFKKQCKMPENKNLSIMGIAYNCGFNSKPTFNRVFKNVTGYTPSGYLQQVSEK